MQSKVVFTVLAGILFIVAAYASSAEVASPVNLTFEKEAVDPENPGVWVSTVDGDITGELTTVLLDLRITGPIWHVTFDWIIDADDPDESLTAQLTGILNTMTGGVVMNGTVIEGHLLGSRVHEEGQLVDPDALGFEGLIRIMPQS